MQKKSDKFKHRKECKAGYKRRQQYRKLINAIDHIDWSINWWKHSLVDMPKFKMNVLFKDLIDKGPVIIEPSNVVIGEIK